MSTVSASPARRSADVACLGTCLLFVVAPFERLRPIVSWPGQNVTNLEVAMALAAGARVVALVAAGDRPAWRTAVTAPWIAWLLALWLAAWLAPVFRGNGIRAASRWPAAAPSKGRPEAGPCG